MLTTLRSRLASKAAAVGIAAVLLGGGVAAATGNLPTPAQEAMARVAAQIGINMSNGDGELPEEAAAGQATAAANQAFAEEMAGNAQMFAEAVEGTIGVYTTALGTWTDCIAEKASERESNPETRTGGEFDLTAQCGGKPVLLIPDPTVFGLADPVDVGPPSDVPLGPPSDVPVGPPSDVPVGPPSDLPVGPPLDLPLGPPEDVGSPSDVPVGPPLDLPVGPPLDLP